MKAWSLLLSIALPVANVCAAMGGLVGCRGPVDQMRETTYFPPSVVTDAKRECKTYPCKLKSGRSDWEVKQIHLTAGQAYGIPSPGTTNRFHSLSGLVVQIVGAGTPVTPGTTVAAHPDDRFTLYWTENPACPEYATCTVATLLHGEEIVASTYSIAYEKSSSSVGNGVTNVQSINPTVVKAAWQEQLRHLPSLANEVSIPGEDHGFGWDYEEFTAARFDEKALVAANWNVSHQTGGFRPSSYTGVVNVYVVARSRLTESLFALYQQRVKTKKDEAADWKASTVPH